MVLPSGNFPISKDIRRSFNPDAIERHFGSAGVYDGSSISHTPDKIPGARWITDRNNDRRKGNGVDWKGQRVATCAELRENHGEIDNRQTQNDFGNRGAMSIELVAGIRQVMCGAQFGRLIPQVI